MARGISIHIGINGVDPAHYDGWDGKLYACELDAQDMEAIARAAGFETTLLLTRAATRDAVVTALGRAAETLVAGDFLLVTYAGHGGQVPDVGGDEDDFADETWLLHDAQLVDDELAVAWSKVAKGVRVFLVSDSCHSGSVSRAKAEAAAREPAAEGRYRAAPRDVAVATYLRNRAFYDGVAAGLPETPPVPQATVRLISACKDDQTAEDGTFNGRFTGALKRVWNKGQFQGDYAAFHAAIEALMPQRQTPRHSVIGPASAAFDAERPFSIG